ncbi:MAG: hypothetical protein JO218_07590, partial [Burkholderiales bacterium]|nr:hypothetical protein [Burkholderiales bacterium]
VPDITSSVSFEQLNLANDDAAFWQPARFDIIFCRNLLMYFTPAQAQAAVGRLARSLAPDGYLFLGHAENLRGLSNEFHVCHHGEAFYYRRDASRRSQPISPLPSLPPLPMSTRMAPVQPSSDASWVDTIRQATERIAALPRSSGSGAAALERPAPDLAAVRESLQNERYEQAIAQLDILTAEYGGDCDILLLRAVALCHAGATGKAEAVCRRLLTMDEMNAGAHYLLALCREGANDLAGAREHDQIASHLDAEFAMPRLHLGLLAKRQGNYELAARELEQAALLLQREDASRILMFGGGFKREALMALCRANAVVMGDR